MEGEKGNSEGFERKGHHEYRNQHPRLREYTQFLSLSSTISVFVLSNQPILREIRKLRDMVSKCRAPVAEIAVMEVDVRPRTARPPPDLDDLSPSSHKRKKKLAAGLDFDFSTTITTTSFVKLQSRRRRRLVWPEDSVSTPLTMEETSACTSPTSDGGAPGFNCCSSNGCSEVVEESLKSVDLEFFQDEKNEHEVAYKSSRERRESTPSNQFRSTPSGTMESTAGKNEANSGNRSLSSSSARMPAESELEEFFIAAEKNIQKRFAEKYNYDIVEDVPSEGRYEWIRLKP